MFRMILAAIAIVAMVGMLPGVLLPVAAQQSPSATRSFSATSVGPGDEVTVTIEFANVVLLGSVTETLPAGFSYVSSPLDDVAGQVQVTGQDVRFTLLATRSFNYTVAASDMAGDYTFSGTLRDGESDHVVGGDTGVTVVAGEPVVPPPAPVVPVSSGQISVMRAFDPTSVAPGDQVTVTITLGEYGGFGRVTETLPAGFAYVESTLEDSQVVVDGQTVKFTLQAETSFTYTVTASDAVGDHSFSGQLTDSDRMHHMVGGASSLVVQLPAGDNSTRSFSRSQVPLGGQVTVTITLGEYGGFGSVTETLPAGFTYVGSSLDDIQVTELDGNRVSFTLQGDSSFTYRVNASSLRGAYSFYGVLVDGHRSESGIGGASSVTVVRPRPSNSSPSFSSAMYTLSVADGSEAGTNVGDPVTATDPNNDTLTYSLSGTDAGSFAIDSSGQITVGAGTVLDAATQAVYNLTVTAADGRGGRATASVTINVGDSDDPCVVTLMGDGEVSGAWSSDCESMDQQGHYARYYSFTLSGGSDVTITLESSTDTYLYLRAGDAKSGDFLHENDDANPGSSTNSQIEAMLEAGTYTIEATTYGAGEAGSFTLAVSGLGVATTPGDDPCVATLTGDGEVSGTWSSDCESTARSGSYARYYSFTLSEGSDVTITLESGTDPYLFLRAGDAKSGDFLYENDDIEIGVDTNSQIEATLEAGMYTIEATTYAAGATGSFTLTVSGLGSAAMPGGDPCLVNLMSDGEVSGTWSSDCESTDQEGHYARYYSFTLSEGSDVTITLESGTDPYLYLRAGDAKSGAAAYENDDVAPGSDTDSQIEAMLEAGMYTIEATTYAAGAAGSFTLTVGGLQP